MFAPKMSLSSAKAAGWICSDRNVAMRTRAVRRFMAFIGNPSLGNWPVGDLGVDDALRAPGTSPRAADRVVIEDEAAGVVAGARSDRVPRALRGVQEAIRVGAGAGGDRIRESADRRGRPRAGPAARHDRVDAHVHARVSGEEAAFGPHRPVRDVAFLARHANQEDAGDEQQHHDEDRHHRGDAALVGTVAPQSTHVTGLHQGFLSLTSEVSVYVCACCPTTVSRAVTMMTMRRTAVRSATFTKAGAAPMPWASRLKVEPGGFGTGLLAESKYAKRSAVTLSAISSPFAQRYEPATPIVPRTRRSPVPSRQKV